MHEYEIMWDDVGSMRDVVRWAVFELHKFIHQTGLSCKENWKISLDVGKVNSRQSHIIDELLMKFAGDVAKFVLVIFGEILREK